MSMNHAMSLSSRPVFLVDAPDILGTPDAINPQALSVLRGLMRTPTKVHAAFPEANGGGADASWRPVMQVVASWGAGLHLVTPHADDEHEYAWRMLCSSLRPAAAASAHAFRLRTIPWVPDRAWIASMRSGDWIDEQIEHHASLLAWCASWSSRKGYRLLHAVPSAMQPPS